MATHKYAVIRYQALDQCFSNFGRKFFMKDLIEACSRAIFDFTGKENGIQRRQIYDDIKFMISETGYSIPLLKLKDGARTYYRYDNKEFSINKRPLSINEAEQLRDTLIILSRFQGLPQFDWMNEVLVRFENTFGLKSKETRNIVFFEQNPYLRGLQFFSDLFSATLSQQPLNIEYHPAFESTRLFTIHPYALKQYASRWYVVGLSIENDAPCKLRTLAIDRIERFKPVNIKFIPNTDINLDEYFDDFIGITINNKNKPERILLRVDALRYNFIETKPIHHSQKIISSGDSYVIVELKIAYNYELETVLFEFADTVEILEPKHLRDRIRERAKNIIKINF